MPLVRDFTDQLALIDQPNETEELWVRPEVHPLSVIFSKRITVTVKSSREVSLKCGTPLAYIFPVAPVPLKVAQCADESSSELTHFLWLSPMPEEAKRRLRQKMMERKEVFSHHEWDVGCSKSMKSDLKMQDPSERGPVICHLPTLRMCANIYRS